MSNEITVQLKIIPGLFPKRFTLQKLQNSLARCKNYSILSLIYLNHKAARIKINCNGRMKTNLTARINTIQIEKPIIV